MIVYLCLCGALIIAPAQSGNSTLPEVNLPKKSNEDGAKTNSLNKITNLPMVSEGGTLLPNTPDFSSPKEKLNSLITLDEELSKTKEKAVVPRKGVDMLTDENKSSQVEKQIPSEVPNKLVDTKTGNVTTKTTPVLSDPSDIKVKSTSSIDSNKNPKLNKTEVPKKPLVTSYEALVNMEKQIQNDHSKISVAPSTKTMASSQIPSPNQDSIKKVYPSKANNSHPGMIMPVVITILVVPMFAIVGYFALKRGQEAWKNRHYKRMDFLLDGMYND